MRARPGRQGSSLGRDTRGGAVGVGAGSVGLEGGRGRALRAAEGRGGPVLNGRDGRRGACCFYCCCWRLRSWRGKRGSRARRRRLEPAAARRLPARKPPLPIPLRDLPRAGLTVGSLEHADTLCEDELTGCVCLEFLGCGGRGEGVRCVGGRGGGGRGGRTARVGGAWRVKASQAAHWAGDGRIAEQRKEGKRGKGRSSSGPVARRTCEGCCAADERSNERDAPGIRPWRAVTSLAWPSWSRGSITRRGRTAPGCSGGDSKYLLPARSVPARRLPWVGGRRGRGVSSRWAGSSGGGQGGAKVPCAGRSGRSGRAGRAGGRARAAWCVAGRGRRC